MPSLNRRARGRAFYRVALAAAFMAAAGARSWAFEASKAQTSDAKRFQLDRATETVWRVPAGRDLAAYQAFRKSFGTGIRLKYHPRTGAPEIVSGFEAPARGATPEASARAFLDDQKAFLKVDTSELTLKLQRGSRHLLFSQTHDGVPVEFSRIGVHFGADGRIRFVQSNFDPDITTSPTPQVSEAAALAVVSQDIGGAVRAPGALVYFPDDADGKMHLAWKFTFNSRTQGGLWNYYVDADDAALLLRYDGIQYQTYVTSGTVYGSMFPLNPFGSSDGTPTIAPFENEQVYIINNSSVALTDANGFYTFGLQGRVYSSLRGPYVTVFNEHFPNASVDNGSGTWVSFPTPISTPHPYPSGANLSYTIQAPVNPLSYEGNAVRVRVHFSDYDVGEDDGSNESTTVGFVDDETDVRDANGNETANYISHNAGSFFSADVPGNALTLHLVAGNSGIPYNGFDVDVSSYFVWGVDPTSPAPASSYAITWSSATSFDGTWEESNAFYHLNAMHDYMSALAAPDDLINISSYPVIADVHASQDLLNAFFNPQNQGLYFGDGLTDACKLANGSYINCSFGLDATVLHHEYTHWVVNHIYPIVNYGQFGAISEAIADYFSASSLNQPEIGEFVTSGFGGLRYLDDGIGNGSNPATMCTNSHCLSLPGNWTGEIHADSPLISQPLWDIRQYLSANFPNGQSTADSIAFNTLFYFPGSFDEFAQAYQDIADSREYYGSNPIVKNFIASAFAAHGIGATYPNSGPETAIDASTSSVWTGSVYPIADLVYYSLDVGAGQIKATLSLPGTGVAGQWEGLGMTLTNATNAILTQAEPAVSNSDGGGVCPTSGDCYTNQPTLTLTYQATSPGVYYLIVSCGTNDSGSIGACNNPNPYSLALSLTPQNTLAGTGINAIQSGSGVVNFSFAVPSFERGAQPAWSFCYARLRDQNLNPMTDTASAGSGTGNCTGPGGAVPLSIMQTPTISNGVMSGAVSINSGTSARYPAVGTAYLDIVGVNQLGTQQSLGLSQAINLEQGSSGSFTAYNNIINPNQGQTAILKATTNGPGNLSIKVYTLIGEYLRTLYDGPVSGSFSTDWDGRNASGATVASGVYILQAEGPGVNSTVKVVVVK